MKRKALWHLIYDLPLSVDFILWNLHSYSEICVAKDRNLSWLLVELFPYSERKSSTCCPSNLRSDSVSSVWAVTWHNRPTIIYTRKDHKESGLLVNFGVDSRVRDPTLCKRCSALFVYLSRKLVWASARHATEFHNEMCHDFTDFIIKNCACSHAVTVVCVYVDGSVCNGSPKFVLTFQC